MWGWRVVIGLASIGQVAAGLTFFALAKIREAAPFGLALCAGIGLPAVASQATGALVRVAIAANVLLALMVMLGVVPLVVALATNAAEPRLVGFAIGGAALAAASAGNAVGLWRLSLRTARQAEPDAAPDRGRHPGSS